MMTSTKKLIVIVGATASGKTALSIEIAKALGCEIVSADSRQIYRQMDIGTAKPTPQELAQVHHHLISTLDVTQNYNAGDYERQAIEIISMLHQHSDYVVLVGGSGMYINAVCNGMDALPDSDPELRGRLNSEVAMGGLDVLCDRLAQLDPEYYAVVDKKNPNRIIRALEVCILSGQKYSSLRFGKSKERDFEVIKIGIDMPRDQIYDRINRRVDIMVGQGLVAEARSLYHLRECNALKTVGYSELFDYFDGHISESEALDLIKRNSRRYAKRQTTWFGRDESIHWFSPVDVKKILTFIKK